MAEPFPEWATLPIERVDPGGWDNRTFRLGAKMRIRLPSAEAYAAQVEKEQLWLPRLGSGLPLEIPRPLAEGRAAKGYRWAWDEARRSCWEGEPVWIHGDVSAANLIVRGGVLSGVIDFGCCGVGDPACDLTIAWTFFSGESRAVFRNAVGLDEATWGRARGWALWKALITMVGNSGEESEAHRRAREVVEAVVSEG